MNNKRMKKLLVAVLHVIGLSVLLAAIIEAKNSTIIFVATYIYILGMALKTVWDINHKSSERNNCALEMFDILAENFEDNNSNK